MTFRPFTVSVPASSANLGPGFDTLGLAVEMLNTVEVAPAARWELILTGAGAERLPTGERNLLYRSVMTAARRWGVMLPPARLVCDNVIPLSRGLGSSSAAIVAGLTVAAVLSGAEHDPEDLLRIAAEIEGHPDNVTPALFGGVQACALVEGRVLHVSVPLARPLRLAMFIPDTSMPTREARRAIPKRVELHDAVFNISRACLLVAALAAGDYDVLQAATQDMLHQPPRSRIFPAMTVLIRAALEAGALGAFLSGAGSTVMALVDGGDDANRIATAMAEVAARDNLPGRAAVSHIRDRGATVEFH